MSAYFTTPQLFFHLINGVPTGFHRDIPLSNCLAPIADDDTHAPPLSIHLDSWKSAHEDPEVTSRLAQEEIDNQWVDLFPGDATEAQSHFPAGISVGKLGVAYSDSRPPRRCGPFSGGPKSTLFYPREEFIAISKGYPAQLSYSQFL